MSEAWHSKSIETVLEELHADSLGLKEEEVKQRLEKYGLNELKERKRTTALQIFLNQFKDIFVVMLLIATAISFAVGETTNAATIATIVVLNSVVGFVQEYRSEKAMEAMRKLTAPKARLMRNGKEVLVSAKEVVPGDIVLLESGDRVPADSRLIEVVDLRTDEAVLTGESTQVGKRTETVDENAPVADRRNMIFTATYITYGRGKAVVTSTGMETEFGKIAEMVQSVEVKKTPLKLKLDSFAKKLGIIVVFVCIAIFVLELLNPARPGTVVENFMIAIALAVSAVPEGLPAVVTISLALGARELAKRNAIIRRLASAETLGAITVICSDKTGTLTKSEMTVREILTNSKMIEVTGVGYEAKGQFLLDSKPLDAKEDTNLNLLLGAGAVCTNASYDGEKVIGDTTEGALIVAATKAGMTKKELEKKYPRVHEIPFTSERKRMTTVHKMSEEKLLVFMKGAPEVILDRCTKIFKNGEPKKLAKKERQKILKANEQMATDALRVLGVAFKELIDIKLEDFRELSKTEEINKHVEGDLVFVGLVGMIDPPREEAKEANKLCQQAGIKTIMITGDHKLTAVAVAKEIGIIKGNPADMALTGAELDTMSDEEFEKIVKEIRVYARVAPEHKLRIVKALKKKGEIVAMTGDGINDAPALKQADIGIAMGITGTDVTKEAADIVLADDNFATIVGAIKHGRVMYDNIRKFTFFLIRSNFDELAAVGTFALLGLPLPFLPTMILWINLVTDGGPALALSMDSLEKGVMERPPRNPREGILHGRLLSLIASFLRQYVALVLVFCFVWLVVGKGDFNLVLGQAAFGPYTVLNKAQTMAFMESAMCELTVVWNCRSEKHNAFKVGFFSNKFLLASVVVGGLLTASLCYVPILQHMFHTVPLNLFDWILILSVASSGLLILPEVFYNRKILKWR